MDGSLPYYRVITEEYSPDDKPIEDPAHKFSFECDSFQNHSFYHISKGENVLVTAHTGSGKTAVAKYAIAHYIRLGKRVVYTSPIKALSNQKYKELLEDFEGQVEVGLMTGDNKIKPDAQVVIMTTEILRNALYDIGKSDKVQKEVYFEDNFIDSIGCVIFDEVHYINDKDRGRVWEETIILLDPKISIVMLSATIDKAEQFAEWIGNSKKKMVNLIPTTHRVIPLEHYIYSDKKLFKIQDRNDKFYDPNFDTALKTQKSVEQSRKNPSKLYLINELVEYMKEKDLLQAIFFAFSRKNCERYAKMISQDLITYQERAEIEKIFNKYMHSYESDYKHVNQYHTIKNLMLKGVAYHHSGLLPILKEIVEIIFQRGLIKVLFATETFAVGVNMPTRTIVFTEVEKYTSHNGRRMLGTGEYKQMSGRAGRRGLDKNGTVIILPLYDFPTRQSMKSMMLDKVPHIESKFYVDYQFILKIIQSNSKNMDQFINASLYQVDNKKIIASHKYELDKLEEKLSVAKAKVDKTMLDIFDKYDKFEKLERECAYIGAKLTNRQMKDKRTMMAELNRDRKLSEAYKYYCNYNALKEKVKDGKYQIDMDENHIEVFSSDIVTFLAEFGYINTNYNANINQLGMDNVTMKGILVAQINECNAFILTEMITRNMFDDLEAEEIIAMLAIFINDNGRSMDNDMTLDNLKSYNVPNIVIQRLNNVQKIIDVFVERENDLRIYSGQTNYWDISYEYVHIVYMWASGTSLGEIMNILDTYEGNFIKNILKINNIAHDLACLSHIYGNLKIIPQLEQVEDKLVRDIVTVNSLYLK
jgi:superfamily II RNA helicase